MSYKLQRFLLMSLDPVHIGTGGFRLGRVDNSIVREPGTKLPKIPGTSLSGAIRAYAAYRYESPGCAGQGEKSKKTDYEGHCGGKKCPICYTFGSLKTQNADGEQQAYAGVVNLFDAHILFFPVHSMAGPVWVSTSSRLQEFGFDVGTEPANHEECILADAWEGNQEALNLGWLMLNARKDGTVTPPSDSDFGSDDAWQLVKNRLVLVTDKVFSQVVSSNLEVRTSVAIDPTTGAAHEGALFTYEAIPRATWLAMDVVEDDYRWEREEDGTPKEENGRLKTDFPVTTESKIRKRKLEWDAPLKVVRDGLEMIEQLGVGGMGTRGFGRVRLVDDWPINSVNGANHE